MASGNTRPTEPRVREPAGGRGGVVLQERLLDCTDRMGATFLRLLSPAGLTRYSMLLGMQEVHVIFVILPGAAPGESRRDRSPGAASGSAVGGRDAAAGVGGAFAVAEGLKTEDVADVDGAGYVAGNRNYHPGDVA